MLFDAHPPIVTPYTPSEIQVRGGTYYSFQPGNGDSVREYAADLATRFFRENRDTLAGAPPKKPFKCGPPENARAWGLMRDAYFGAIPALLRPLITTQIRKQSFNVMKGQGLGRHSREELYALGAADLRSIAGFLGDKPFFMGERATSADATVYAWLSSILDTSLASPLQDAARAHATLVSYTARLGQHYFG